MNIPILQTYYVEPVNGFYQVTTKNTGGKYKFDKRHIALVKTEINIVSFPDEIYISYYFEMIDISKQFKVVFAYEENEKNEESIEFVDLAKLNGSTGLAQLSKLETVSRNLMMVSKCAATKLESFKKMFESPTKKYVVTYCQKQKYNMLKNNNIIALYHSIY